MGMGRPASSGPDCGAAQVFAAGALGSAGPPHGSESEPPWGGTCFGGEEGGSLSLTGWSTQLPTVESRRLLTLSLVLLNASRQASPSRLSLAWFKCPVARVVIRPIGISFPRSSLLWSYGSDGKNSRTKE